MRTVKLVRRVPKLVPKDLFDSKRNVYIEPVILKDKEDSQMYEVPDYLAIGMLGHCEHYAYIGAQPIKLRIPFPNGQKIIEYFPWKWNETSKKWERTKKDKDWTK